MKVSLVLASALLACFAMVSPAQAEPIQGEFTMAGDNKPVGGTGLGDATGIDFIGDDFVVIAANGHFAAKGVSGGDTGSIKDFTFSPSLSGAPISEFWKIGDFKFELQTISVIHQSSNGLVLGGLGVITHPDFDKTNGSFAISTQRATFGTLYSFSGHAIPEPASLSLMGLGALGLFVARRRRKAAA